MYINQSKCVDLTNPIKYSQNMYINENKCVELTFHKQVNLFYTSIFPFQTWSFVSYL
jgi:hypothetical protein